MKGRGGAEHEERLEERLENERRVGGGGGGGNRRVALTQWLMLPIKRPKEQKLEREVLQLWQARDAQIPLVDVYMYYGRQRDGVWERGTDTEREREREREDRTTPGSSQKTLQGHKKGEATECDDGLENRL